MYTSGGGLRQAVCNLRLFSITKDTRGAVHEAHYKNPELTILSDSHLHADRAGIKGSE
ncbi:hypothetical protein K340107D12_35350 [Blautia parvula]|uniref:Uncharacterized protein n=1 Tax=Blautia parvula TaxID=2877527 RepID=A0ABQ0BW23_9FIRM